MRVGINVQAGTIEVDLEGGVAIKKMGDDFNINPLDEKKGVTPDEVKSISLLVASGLVTTLAGEVARDLEVINRITTGQGKALNGVLERLNDLESPGEDTLGRVSSLESSRKADVSKALSTTALLMKLTQSHDVLVALVETVRASTVKNTEDIESLLQIIAEIGGFKIERDGVIENGEAEEAVAKEAVAEKPSKKAPDPFDMIFAELKKRLPADAAFFYKKLLQQTYRQGKNEGVVMLSWSSLTKMCGKSRETARKRIIAFSNMGLLKRLDELGKGGPEKQVKLQMSGWNNARSIMADDFELSAYG